MTLEPRLTCLAIKYWVLVARVITPPDAAGKSVMDSTSTCVVVPGVYAAKVPLPNPSARYTVLAAAVLIPLDSCKPDSGVSTC